MSVANRLTAHQITMKGEGQREAINALVHSLTRLDHDHFHTIAQLLVHRGTEGVGSARQAERPSIMHQTIEKM
jgi:hypothetical protein